MTRAAPSSRRSTRMPGQVASSFATSSTNAETSVMPRSYTASANSESCAEVRGGRHGVPVTRGANSPMEDERHLQRVGSARNRRQPNGDRGWQLWDGPIGRVGNRRDPCLVTVVVADAMVDVLDAAIDEDLRVCEPPPR